MTVVLAQNDNLSTKDVSDHPKRCLSSVLPQLFFIFANSRDWLKHSIIPCMIRGHLVNNFLDIGASGNFISEGIVSTIGIIPKGKISKVNMASSK